MKPIPPEVDPDSRAPMCDSNEEQHEDFYDDLGELIRSQKSSCVVVSGDFNARTGSQRQGERFVGPNSAESRNTAGERLANFCEIFHLYHGNSQFMKTPTKSGREEHPAGHEKSGDANESMIRGENTVKTQKNLKLSCTLTERPFHIEWA
ncbi:hypothetical protein TELCIR_00699 [Teladorsagia circumcincta]|uniref:Endonuclease/exonuclease/phosphatase domain-containing protein n=1 Tax=Teladorsagia circumcincta TaxID=45464 RepID=A0A2G9V3V6_TELCI|nr:hypothetical protein TELCIR_00699 [Teladorsagia circumcincta]